MLRYCITAVDALSISHAQHVRINSSKPSNTACCAHTHTQKTARHHEQRGGAMQEVEGDAHSLRGTSALASRALIHTRIGIAQGTAQGVCRAASVSVPI
jgi:hypothetical protein